MAITPPTPPTPPSPPKITLGDAARDAQANTAHTTGDAQAEQQARDSVAQGGGALSKTTTGAPKSGDAAERPNAAARTDAARGDAVSTSAAKVDRGTSVEGQTGADAARGLDLAQENAALKQQLANTEQKPPEVPSSYTATSGLYWVGLIGAALVLGLIFFRRFFQKKPQIDAEQPSLGERILARDEAQGTTRADVQEQQPPRERGAHEDLLAAAERTRRARDTRGEILPEYTGLTAGEALARLMEEERAAQRTDVRPVARRTAPPKAAEMQRKTPAAPAAPPAAPAPPVPPPQTQSTGRTEPQTEEKPRFEVRV